MYNTKPKLKTSNVGQYKRSLNMDNRLTEYAIAYQAYSDAHKEYHGVRPYSNGHSIDVDNIAELEKQTQRYYDWVAEDLAQERADEDASINACMAAGAPDIDTAMRWLEQDKIHSEWA
tara:strand:- start:2295 stop:2648 length:354 start_codon:yes stop_codon:yes gene_type:complete